MSKERLMKLLLAPCITEKSALVSSKYRQIVFKIVPDATKREVKQAVELMFEVEVEKVQLSNVKGKCRLFQRVHGRRSDWKKAYVKLKPGHDINFLGT